MDLDSVSVDMSFLLLSQFSDRCYLTSVLLSSFMIVRFYELSLGVYLMLSGFSDWTHVFSVYLVYFLYILCYLVFKNLSLFVLQLDFFFLI